MTNIHEGSLIFSFSDVCDVLKYDNWSFYRERFQRIQNTKAVDILCVTNEAAWLIEIKDYGNHDRNKSGRIEDEVAQKVRDTLAGLAAADANGNNMEQQIAGKALNKHRWRVVLHVEPADNLVCNISNIQINLQKLLQAIDGRPLVTNTKYAFENTPWTVRTDS